MTPELCDEIKRNLADCRGHLSVIFPLPNRAEDRTNVVLAKMPPIELSRIEQRYR